MNEQTAILPDPKSDSTQSYALVAEAIAFIRTQALQQPSLTDVAQHVGLSDHHLQRVFSQWAGVSPKRFLQFLTKEHAKRVLRETSDVLNAALTVGLSTPSRLHDLIVTCEAMTPGQYKSLGAGVAIEYGWAATPFGIALLGRTERGLCHFEFTDHDRLADIARLQAHWPNALLTHNDAMAQALVAKVFAQQLIPGRLHLVLKGTNFQLKIWEALLTSTPGQLLSYSALAKLAGQPKAQRAVGTALAANTVGFLIPCHRVLRESGELGQYRWGTSRKAAMLAWEAARIEQIQSAPGKSSTQGDA